MAEGFSLLSYVNYLVSTPWESLIVVFLLSLGRIVPAIALVPFFGAKILPDTIRFGLGVSLVLLLLPFFIIQTKDISHIMYTDPLFIGLLVKEICLGAVLGFIMAAPFYAAQGAGALVDHQRGSQSLDIMDPSTQTQTPSLGLFYNNAMMVIFFSIGGPFFFMEALFTSYTVIPIDQFVPVVFFNPATPFWSGLFGLIEIMVTVALQLGAPSLLATVLTEMFMGVVNRMAPQVQVSFLLWSAKSFIALLLLLISWYLILQQMDMQAYSWLEWLKQIVLGWAAK